MAGHRSKKRKHIPDDEPQTANVEAMLDKFWWTEPEKCKDAAEHKIATLLARVHLNVTTSWYKDEGWHGDVLQMLLQIDEAFRELKIPHALVLRKIQHKLDACHDKSTQKAAFFVMKQQLKAEKERSEGLGQELHAQADMYCKEHLRSQAASHSKLYELLDEVTAENEAYQEELERLSAKAGSKNSKLDDTSNKKTIPDKIELDYYSDATASEDQLLINDKLLIDNKPHTSEEEGDDDKSMFGSSSSDTSEQTLLDLAEELKVTKKQYQKTLQKLEKSNKDLSAQRALRDAMAQDYEDLLKQREAEHDEAIERLKTEHDNALEKQAKRLHQDAVRAMNGLAPLV